MQIVIYNLDSLTLDRTKKAESVLNLLIMPGPNSMKELIKIDLLYWNVFTWTSFIPRTTTQEELISTGNLNLIKKDSIKALILIIKQLNENIDDERMHMRREYEEYLYDRAAFYREYLPYLDIKKSYETHHKVIDTSFSKTRKTELLNQVNFIQNDLVTKNGLKLAAGNNRRIVSLYMTQKETIHKLIQLINAELAED